MVQGSTLWGCFREAWPSLPECLAWPPQRLNQEDYFLGPEGYYLGLEDYFWDFLLGRACTTDSLEHYYPHLGPAQNNFWDLFLSWLLTPSNHSFLVIPGFGRGKPNFSFLNFLIKLTKVLLVRRSQLKFKFCCFLNILRSAKHLC